MTHPFGEDHGFNGGISHRQMHMRAPSHGFDGGQQFDEDDEPHMGPVSRMPSDFRGNHRSNSAFHMDQPSPNDFHENRGFNGAPPPHMGIRAPGSRFSHDDHGFNPAFPQSHMGPGPPTLGRNSSFNTAIPTALRMVLIRTVLSMVVIRTALSMALSMVLVRTALSMVLVRTALRTALIRTALSFKTIGTVRSFSLCC